MKRGLRLIALLCGIMIAAFFTGCERKLELSSVLSDRQITVDGRDSDWPQAAVYLLDEQKVCVGFCNDADFLYVLFESDNREVFPQMMRGFTVWFDPKGGSRKTLGIHFPLAMQGLRPGMAGGPGNVNPGTSAGPDKRRTGKSDSAGLRPDLSAVQRELEVLVPGDDVRQKLSIFVAPSYGLEARIAIDSTGKLVYEIKVPLVLSADHRYAIGSDVGKITCVGITMESDKAELSMPSGRGFSGPGGTPPSGGMGGPGGSGGMPPGGMGGPPPSGGRGGSGQGSQDGSTQSGANQSQERLKIKAVVTLAK